MANKSLGSSTGVNVLLPNGDDKTPLHQALESLNVNLEQELMRFRQSRSQDGAAQPFNSQLKFRSKKRRRGLNLIQVQGQSAAASQSRPQQSAPRAEAQSAAVVTAAASYSTQIPTAVATPSSSPTMPPVPPSRSGALATRQGLPTAQTYSPQGSTGQALQRHGRAISPYHQLPNDYLESTEALLDSLPSVYDDDQANQDVDYEPSLREQLATPLGIGALLLLLVGSAGFGYMVTSPKTAEFLRENALVQVLFGGNSGEESEGEPEPSIDVTETAPTEPQTGLQGIGPDLSEDEFQDLDLGRLSTLDQDDATASAARTPLPGDLAESDGLTRTGPIAGTALDGVPSATAAPAPAEGNTAATADPSPVRRTTSQPTTITRPVVPNQPQPATAPAPRASSPPRQPTVAPLPQAIQTPQPTRQTPPQPMRSAPPTPAAAPPQPLSTQPVPQPLPQQQTAPPAPLSQSAAPSASSAAPPAPITQPPPQPSFYVVTDYTGDSSLQNARSAVGGAYVRNFSDGARIQMGAFSQESSARNLVQQLQGQGIPARVYAP